MHDAACRMQSRIGCTARRRVKGRATRGGTGKKEEIVRGAGEED